MTARICSIEGCGRKHYARGWCNMHWSRWLRHGDPLALYPDAKSEEDRFFVKVSLSANGCWTWSGSRDKKGYGNFKRAGGWQAPTVKAHRWAYVFFVTEIPDGLQLDHLCRNHSCVNPWHLKPVTAAVNTSRGQAPTAINARKEYCKRGHLFDEANTRVETGGRRRCRACKNENERAARHSAREERQSA